MKMKYGKIISLGGMFQEVKVWFFISEKRMKKYGMDLIIFIVHIV
jgi:hypothetical protein